MKLKDIVNDWGGFEELVKDLHTDGTVEVQRNVTLTGNSGATRQIDVFLTHKSGPYEYSTLIECKYWNSKVERQHVDVLHSSMLDLNASKGVFFTTLGYQKGAEIYARAKGIEIFVIRELTDDEWGRPGKIVDFYLHIISTTICDLDLSKSSIISTDPNNTKRVYLKLDFTDKRNVHPIISKHKERFESFEAYLQAAAQHAVTVFQEEPFLINGGEDCTRYFSVKVEMPFREKDEDLLIGNGNQVLLIPSLTFNAGIKVNQSRFIFDRSEKYIYALVVEDCINERRFFAAKEPEQVAEWSPAKTGDLSNQPYALANGSILTVILKEIFDPDEMKGLKDVDMKAIKKKA